VDLAARRRVLVGEQDREAEFGSAGGGGEPSGTGADDEEVIALVELFDAGDLGHSAASVRWRRPCWVSMRMPSTSGTRQPCRLPMPSMTTRQSKQTPIRQ